MAIGVKAQEMATVGVAEVLMRTYFSSYYLWAAKHFTRAAEEIEVAHSGPPKFDIEHRAYVMNAILSAVAFVEAAINEIFKDAADGHDSYIEPLGKASHERLKAAWGKSNFRAKGKSEILQKYQTALTCCNKNGLDEAAQPYEDMQLLIYLRNGLTHAYPETRNTHDLDELSRTLKSKFDPNRLMNNSASPYFPDHCLGAGCAAWAIASSRALADEFFQRLGVQPNYQRVSFDA